MITKASKLMLWQYLLVAQSRAVGMAFLANSLIIGTWFTLIPVVKSDLGLSEGQLGLALLGMPVGGIIAMPLSAIIIAKINAGRTVLFTGLLFFWIFLLPVVSTSLVTLTLALMVSGMINGIMAISINASASIVEKKLGKSIMSTCHGFWSLGAMLGAGSAGMINSMGVAPLWHMMGAAIFVSILLVLHIRPYAVISDDVSTKTRLSMPTRPVLILSSFLFCIFLSEGAIADWAAVYITDHLKSSMALAGWGFGTFSFFMAIGRFQGDALIPKIGKSTIFTGGMILGLIGLSIFLVTSHVGLALAGLAIAGLGFSCIVPLIISAAASVKGMQISESIATVSTVGSLGLMIGPPLIGFIAEVSSLHIAFMLLPILALYLLIFGRKYV